MKPIAPPPGSQPPPRPPPDGEPPLRTDLHVLIETLPDAVLEPLRQLLRRAKQERLLPALTLVVHAVYTFC